MSAQGRLVQVRTISGQARSDLAGTVHINVALGQVMTRPEHIWSGKVRSGYLKSKSCQTRSCQVMLGQNQVMSGLVRLSQVKVRLSQVRSGQ